MPGELIEARDPDDWPLAEIRGLLMGTGTEYEIGPGPIGGLGLPPIEDADRSHDHADGISAGRDYYGPRTITIPVLTHGDTDEIAAANFIDLCTAWERVTDGVDIELHLQLPGWGHVYVSGRPRGLIEDAEPLRGGVIASLCTFRTTTSHELIPVGS